MVKRIRTDHNFITILGEYIATCNLETKSQIIDKKLRFSLEKTLSIFIVDGIFNVKRNDLIWHVSGDIPCIWRSALGLRG